MFYNIQNPLTINFVEYLSSFVKCTKIDYFKLKYRQKNIKNLIFFQVKKIFV